MVSRNTVMKRNFILFTIKKSWLTPTELVHFFRECALSKNLFSIAVSPTGETRSIAKTHGAN